MQNVTTYPAEISALVEALIEGVHNALGGNMVGFYLRGSLALGDFDVDTSDVDILVVTEKQVSPGEYEALDRLHARIGARDNTYGRQYEVAYVDRASLRQFRPCERRHPTVGADWSFCWGEHREDFNLERWVVREHGIPLVGPDPETLIEPISRDDLRAAVVGGLRFRMEDWAAQDEHPDWLSPRYYQAFEIETLCRAMCTLDCGQLPTKPEAVHWALQFLPQQWRPLVEWSQEHRDDKTEEGSKIPEIIRFTRWAAPEAGAT